VDDRPATITIPTELERADAFWGFAVCATTVLAAKTALEWGVPWPWLVLPVLVVMVWWLTGEGAGDTPWIGAIAAGLRSKLGLRRAHEWALAFSHFFEVRIIPDWRAWAASSPSKPVAPVYRRIG
jgi:hypothetical protein